MTIVNIIPINDNHTLSISDTLSNNVLINGSSPSIQSVIINQGSVGPPGPPGAPGTGVLDLIAGSGISINEIDHTYTISLVNNITSNNQSRLQSCGRLTLQSNDPIYQNNISSSTIYFTPYFGNNINLYDISSSQWKDYSFNQLSLILSGMTTNTNYDIFIYYNGSNLILEKNAWTNNITRLDNIIYQDGIPVKSGSLNKRYLGTFRATSATTTEDSSSKRFVYNANNQIFKTIQAYDNTSHTYSLSTIRSYRNITTVGLTRVELISGLNNKIYSLNCISDFTTESNISSVGISLDSTTTFNSSVINSTYINFGSESRRMKSCIIDNINIDPGYHYIQLCQSGSSISTFYNAFIKGLILC